MVALTGTLSVGGLFIVSGVDPGNIVGVCRALYWSNICCAERRSLVTKVSGSKGLNTLVLASVGFRRSFLAEESLVW